MAYTPEKTTNYENLVRLSYQQQCAGQAFDKDVQLRVWIDATFPIPKATSKKKREAMEAGHIFHTKKPDCDNIAKACLDALNGIAYYDDSQVCILAVSKRYGAEPKVKIKIGETNGSGVWGE